MNSSGFERATKTPEEIGYLGFPCSTQLDTVFTILDSILAVVILAGNILACAVFLKERRLRSSYMNIYFVSLAVSDVFMGALVMPFYSVFCSGCAYSLTSHCWVIRALKGVTFGANVLNLIAISLDRHEAFFRPLRYSSNMTIKRVALILTAVWGIPFILTGARNFWQHSDARTEAIFIDRVYSNILTIFFVIIPFFLLLAINLRILYAIKKQVQRIQAENSTKMRLSLSEKPRRTTQNVRNVKGSLACVVIVLVYIICWLPRIFYNFCFLFRRVDLVRPLLIKLSLSFLFLQSSLNPFIYSFYRVEFRQAALRLMRCQNRPVDRDFSRSQSQNSLD